MDSSKILSDIKKQQYHIVPFYIARPVIEKAVLAFFQFLKFPQDVKEQFNFKINPEDRGSVVGYMRKNSVGDDKETFHYNKWALDAFTDLIQKYDKIVEQFFSSAEVIYQETQKIYKEIFHSLDIEYPGIYKKFFPEDREPLLYLRSVKYDYSKPGEFLARGHYDRGCFSLALAESAPGLRIGKNPKTLEFVEHQVGKAIFFLGFLGPHFTSKDLFSAWHDVIQKNENTYSPDISRWALVCFLDQADKSEISIPTFEEAHTPVL